MVTPQKKSYFEINGELFEIREQQILSECQKVFDFFRNGAKRDCLQQIEKVLSGFAALRDLVRVASPERV